MTERPVRFRVVPQEQGTALAALVSTRLPELSKAQGTALVKAGAVYMGHLRIRVPSTRVATGDRITVYPRALEIDALDPNRVVRFVYRDASFVVLDKPAGVPVAATRASARGTLSEALRRVLHKEGVSRPYVGLVHRLDRGASGLVVFTVRGVANKSLHRAFCQHRIERTYRVRVHGEAPPTFDCRLPLVERAGGQGSKVARCGEPRAKPAVTRFRRLTERDPVEGTSLLEAQLETGRTHQIRVHAAACGHSVCGDRRYGSHATDAEALCLQAWRLRFEHPISGEDLELTAPPPEWAPEWSKPAEDGRSSLELEP